MLLAMSLDGLALPPDQQSRVEQIQADLLDKMRPAADIERKLDMSLAEGIASTAIDAPKVSRALDALAASSGAAQSQAAADLDQLHALLTPPQRAALIDKLEAQWALWKRANVGDQNHVAAMSKEIGLWPGQVEKLKEQLVAAEAAAPLRQAEIERHLHEFEEAFEADHFEAKSLASAGQATAHLAGWGAARLARFCEAANPLLVPEQRNRLVALLREHAEHDETRGRE
jgi:Spy/CpxP family protein refolding chaperone